MADKIMANYKYRILSKRNNLRSNKLILILFLSVVGIVLSDDYNNDIHNPDFSYIKINISRNDNGSILNDLFFHYNSPVRVYINQTRQYDVSSRYNFSETENIVELMWNYSINNISHMFSGCSDIVEIDFSNFDTSYVNDMEGMFHNCKSLISLNLSNFNTANVRDMQYMFYNCSSLSSLNLSNFNTANVTDMQYMFYNCSSLPSLDLSNFVTSHVTQMGSMFKKCSKLISLDISNFNTSQVENMDQLFYGCLALETLNISKFITSRVKNMYGLIYNCSSLTSLDISNFETSNLQNSTCMFYGCNKLEFINMSNFIENTPYNYDNMFENVPDNIVICLNTENTNNSILPQIRSKACSVIDCSDNWKSKQKKIIKENNTCIDNYSSGYIYNTGYIGSEKETYTNNNSIDNIHTTQLIHKPIKEENNTLNKILTNLIENGDKYIKNGTNAEVVNYYNKILTSAENLFTSGYSTVELDKGNDQELKVGNMFIKFTSVKNQKNKKDEENNMTIIDLGECESLLRGGYNLSDNKTLYMKQIGVDQVGMRIPKMEYDIYSKLYGDNLTRLNKSFCKESKILLSLPIKLNEDTDKLNTSSDYFNDICYQSTSESGTDILLKDRQKEFVEKNKTVCQEECDFAFYNKTTQKAECSCSVKETSSNYTEMYINKNKLYDKFNSKENSIGNIALTKCNVLSSKENIETNTGFFLLLFIIVIFIIIFIIFCCKGYDLIKNKFEDVIYNRFEKE